MRLIFRYDDYCSNPEEDAVDCRIFHCFNQHETPLVVGIVPDKAQDVNDPHSPHTIPMAPHSRSFQLLASLLKQGWQLAIHGNQHLKISPDTPTEFAGLPLKQQQKKISMALNLIQQHLPNYQPLVFIPPWNSYDENTCQALLAARFKILCAGPGTSLSQKGELLLIPSLLTLRQLISYVKFFSFDDLASVSKDLIIVVTLHAYEFMSPSIPSPIKFEELDSLLTQLGRRGVHSTVFSLEDSAQFFFNGKNLTFESKRFYIAWVDQHHRWPQASLHAMNFSKPQFSHNVLSCYARLIYLAWTFLKPLHQIFLQIWRRWMAIFSRVKGIVFVLSHPVGGYRIHFCPLCQHSGPFEPARTRTHARCLYCGSLERHRFLHAVLSSRLPEKKSRKKALVIAPDKGLVVSLKRYFHEVVTADLCRDGVDIRLDLQQLPLSDNSFDLILAIHVLDEVPDDILALSECLRILNSEGWLIAPVPQLNRDLTQELPVRRSDGKVRLAGHDYELRILNAGFKPYGQLTASDWGPVADRSQFRILNQSQGVPPEDEQVTIYYKCKNSTE